MAIANGIVDLVDLPVRTMARSPILPPTVAGSSFEVSFIDEAGAQRREPLPSCWNLPFERAGPSRSFPSFKGQRNFPGLWWSATTGEHVGYESWVERDVAMLLDFDPEIVAFSSQPFWLIWPGQQGERRHAPDFFARRADGTGVVIDVRPDDLVDPKAAEVLDATASACGEVGWESRRTGGPSAVLAANVRWLAGYRHPRVTAIPAAAGPRSLTRSSSGSANRCRCSRELRPWVTGSRSYRCSTTCCGAMRSQPTWPPLPCH